jgi:hypothetical protein
MANGPCIAELYLSVWREPIPRQVILAKQPRKDYIVVSAVVEKSRSLAQFGAGILMRDGVHSRCAL